MSDIGTTIRERFVLAETEQHSFKHKDVVISYFYESITEIKKYFWGLITRTKLSRKLMDIKYQEVDNIIRVHECETCKCETLGTNVGGPIF